ncbi:MAG: AEC family transporter [bacterium]
MATVVTILSPLLLVILIGFLSGRWRFLDLAAARVLSRFVFLFAMPAAVFNFFAHAQPPNALYIPMMLAYTVIVIILMVGSALATQNFCGLTVQESGAHAFVSGCGNAVFLGFPIALSVPGWGQPFLMLMMAEGVMTFTIAALFLRWQDKSAGSTSLAIRLGQSLIAPLRNPIIVASLFGIIVSIAGLTMPSGLDKFFTFFGAVAAPTGLFVLGLFIALLPTREIKPKLRNISFIGIVKLLIFPTLTYISVGSLTGFDPALTGAATLFTAMPPAVGSLIQASHYGVYEKETAAALVLLSPLSLIGISLILLFLG